MLDVETEEPDEPGDPLRVYTIADWYAIPSIERPPYICIGHPPGKNRPAIWLNTPGAPSIILASFHGEMQLKLMQQFLDMYTDRIDRVIAFNNNRDRSR